MTMTEPSLDEFLTHVRRSGLLEDAKLDAHLETHVGVTTARQAATLLVRDGILTPFQCRLLLEGKYRGFLVNAKYKILELLAVGGMGAVYLCEHMLMRRLVAMKVLPRETSDTPGSVERFLREARAVAALDHPNLVRAYDVDRLSHGNSHCIILEFVDGMSLHQLIGKSGRQPMSLCVNAIIQAAEGLNHAHQAGLIHRDVKPSNLLLSRSGLVKVLDLGLARFFDDKADNLTSQHSENAILGTADFIAPEQATNAPIDTRADVYSLGCTLYFMLTGQPPFPDGNVTNKMIWHQTRDPDPIEGFRPDIPAGLIAVVGRMMAKEPERRYANMAEVADALQPFDTTPVALPPESDMPGLCLAVRKLMSDLPKSTGRSTKALSSSADFQLPPTFADSNSRTKLGHSHHDATIDLTEIPTWRGRPLFEQPGSTDHTGATPASRPSPASRSHEGVTNVQTQGNAKLFNLFVSGFIGLAMIVGALIAYQTNKPTNVTSPAQKKVVPATGVTVGGTTTS